MLLVVLLSLVSSELTGLQRGGLPAKPLGEVEKYDVLVGSFKGKFVTISWNQFYVLILDRLAGTGAPE